MDDALPVLPEPDLWRKGDGFQGYTPKPPAGPWFTADTLRAYARAAVAADRAARWQPIETAPKDGSRILCWIATHAGSPWILQWEHDAWRDDEGFAMPTPSHWQPLPEPPTPKEGQTL